jgi:SAM-dependent methyltransferase
VVGVHSHIGSQLTQVTPFVDALKKAIALIQTLQANGVHIQYLNIGGGLGITYSEETPPHPKELAAAISPLLQTVSCQIIMEPGRSIVGNAGILVTKVLYNKDGANKRFVIVDAAMNDLLRPSLYEAHHDIQPVMKNAATWLKPGGRLVMVVTHPCFRIPRQTHWGWDEEKKMEYRRVDRYASEMLIPILTPPFARSQIFTSTYHRPLESYFQAITEAGLMVDGLEEWVSTKESEPGKRSRGENRARREIPLFLALRARRQNIP